MADRAVSNCDHDVGSRADYCRQLGCHIPRSARRNGAVTSTNSPAYHPLCQGCNLVRNIEPSHSYLERILWTNVPFAPRITARHDSWIASVLCGLLVHNGRRLRFPLLFRAHIAGFHSPFAPAPPFSASLCGFATRRLRAFSRRVFHAGDVRNYGGDGCPCEPADSGLLALLLVLRAL